MAKHRTHSLEFKRQVAQEFLAGETLHGLAKRYDLSRNLIPIRSRPMFFIGMGLVTIPLFLLSLTSWQAGLPCSSIFGRIPG